MLQNAFCLLRKRLVRELLSQFCLKLRRDGRRQVGIMGHEWQFQIRFAEYQRVLVGLELYGTPKMRFVHFSLHWDSLELYPLWNQRPPNAPVGHRDDPCETHVHQQWWFFLMREKPDELDSGFIPPFNYANLLWTSELFVARQPLDSVPERPRGDRSNLYRIVPLKALLCPELQPNSRIVAGFGNSPMQRKKLFGAHQDFVEFEQAHRQ